MNYKQLTEKNKVEIDILLKQGLSMREVGRRLGIHHSTISRYKNKKYFKRKIDIEERYQIFIQYLLSHYDRKTCSIEVCVNIFKRRYKGVKCPSVQTVYNWINSGKLRLSYEGLCYRKRKGKRRKSGMMVHFEWNLHNRTVLPISLRPKYIEERNEIGHLEIDTIVGRKNENDCIISIVDRCSRKLWLIKANYKQEYYVSNLIYNYLYKNNIPVKSITVDNGLEFKTLGIAAKKLGVKLYKCDPYCSFQRGTNERTNALVRRFIPKGSSMKMTPQIYLDDICWKINNMPRKIFDFECANEIQYKYK